MKDTLKKLAELDNQRRSVIEQLKSEFNDALKQLFVDNPKLDSIQTYVNNHEFNDGDATSFDLGWEDMIITVDGEEIEREWDIKTKDYIENPLLDSIIELFGQVQDIHEDLYGDAYEHLTIERDEILNN